MPRCARRGMKRPLPDNLIVIVARGGGLRMTTPGGSGYMPGNSLPEGGLTLAT